MRRLLLLFSALPSLATAQPRIQLPEVRTGDLHRLNPAAVALQWRDSLRLDDVQIARLDSIRRGFDKRGDRLADSVKRFQRDVAAFPPDLKRLPDDKPETRKDSLKYREIDSTRKAKIDAWEAQTANGRNNLSEALLTLKNFYDGTVTAVGEVLSADQKLKADRPMAAAIDEFTRRIRAANIR